MIYATMPDVSKSDLQKIISYLDEAAKLYNALPEQTVTTNDGKVNLFRLCRVRPGWGEARCKCRAYMICQLISKLKLKIK